MRKEKKKATIAIIGRPNVGKSTLFNRILRKRLAIIGEEEGVTRDRLCASGELFGLAFDLVDTGGWQRDRSLPFSEEVQKQILTAVQEATSIVMVVDGSIGVTREDEWVARALQRTKKPLCLAINKIDSTAQEWLMHHFYSLGISPLIPISALHGNHIVELLQSALHLSPPSSSPVPTPAPSPLKVAVVGRPNVGKSTLVNQILNQERCVVSETAGTTRDAIDVPFFYRHLPFVFIDTAGIRKRKAKGEAVDTFAAMRTTSAIQRAEICLLLIDATTGITSQDKKILHHIEREGRGSILLLNKWDLVKGRRMEHVIRELRTHLSSLDHYPMQCISAKEGKRLGKIFEQIETVSHDFFLRVKTPTLNDCIEEAMRKQSPPMYGGKRLRIYYTTQIGSGPPRFVSFVNRPELMGESYRKYLIRQLRHRYRFAGVPILFFLKGKEGRGKEGGKGFTKKEGGRGPIASPSYDFLLFEESVNRPCES